jgi:hypothetical protein
VSTGCLEFSFGPFRVIPERQLLTAAPEHNLSLGWTRPLGRDNIIDALLLELPVRRFITIVGSGSIGKTTVALALANMLLESYRRSVARRARPPPRPRPGAERNRRGTRDSCGGRHNGTSLHSAPEEHADRSRLLRTPSRCRRVNRWKLGKAGKIAKRLGAKAYQIQALWEL